MNDKILNNCFSNYTAFVYDDYKKIFVYGLNIFNQNVIFQKKKKKRKKEKLFFDFFFIF